MPAPMETGDAAPANDSDDQDENNDMRSDEEEAEAVREAAQKRAEEAQAQANEDIAMVDAQAPQNPGESMVEEEEIDPLDAFMNGLEAPPANDAPRLISKKKEPQVFDSDDDGANLDAMGDDTDDVIAAAAAKRKRKELPQVDHGKMDYEPFRKDFYSESAELSDMTQEDVEVLRAELDSIRRRRVDVPKSILKWSQGPGPLALRAIIPMCRAPRRATATPASCWDSAHLQASAARSLLRMLPARSPMVTGDRQQPSKRSSSVYPHSTISDPFDLSVSDCDTEEA